MADTSGAGQAAGGEGGVARTAGDVGGAGGGRRVGGASARVNGLAPLDRAGPSHVSFLASERYVAQFAASRAGVVLVSPGFAEAAGPATRVVVDKPHEALLALIPRFHAPPPRVPGIHPTAQLGRGVTLGDEVTIGPFVAIGNGATIGDRAVIGSHCSIGDGARVGDESVLHPGVVLYANSRVGNRVILHSGVRVGSDGFGYVQQGGRHVKIPHVGGCVIEDDVEIGANSTIDRGSIGDTIVGAGTKIDNLVHLGHNVRIGRLCLIMAQVGISGSTHVEDGCVVAGQAGLAGHTTIGAGARIGAQAGVFGSVPPGATWSGYPARPHREALRAQAALFKLPKLLRRLEQLGEGETR